MSRLDELIAEHCPGGVEYKSLGEIATDIYRGSGITRKQVTLTGIPCVRYGEIYTTYGIWFDKCVSHTSEAAITNKKYFEHGDILLAITGESVDEIAKSSAYVGNEKCLAGGDIVVLKHHQDPKYLAYALSTRSAQKQKSKGKVKSKVVHSSIPAIREIRIPIPPLPVQREIVQILDNFTELTAELTTELTAELTARKKQYEYYRNLILNFDGRRDIAVQWFKMGEIIKSNLGGGTPSKSNPAYWNGGVPWASVKDIVREGMYLNHTEDTITEEGLKNSPANLIPKGWLIICTRINPGICSITVKETAINQDLRGLSFQDFITVKYIYYYFHTLNIVGRGTTVKGISVTELENLRIPVPPFDEQERIAAILDRFDALCNDLTSGLPAEIEARRKQYEYYRDKLLTFKEVGT
jgi:type I restriction enzyme S subunit